MALRTRHWQDLTWPEFETLPKDTVAILQTGAMEQHGPHLPVSVDATINEGVLNRALSLLDPEVPALVLPIQKVGCSVEHLRFPGTITSTPETLIALWTEIGESVARAGVKKMLFLNSHGGQPQIIDIVCRRLRIRETMFCVNAQWSRLGRPEGLVDSQEGRYGIHAGYVETSVMLRLDPANCKPKLARDFRNRWIGLENQFATLTPEGTMGFGWQAQDLHPAGAVGNAARATAEDGEKFLAFAGAKVAGLIGDIARFDREAWLINQRDQHGS
jgi:creatinine amidohydrolase